MTRSRYLFPAFALLLLASVAPVIAEEVSGAESLDTDQKKIRIVGEVAMVPAPASDSEAGHDADSSAPELVTASNSQIDEFLEPDTNKEKQPFMQLRILQDLQGQTAKGSTHALRAQRNLISRINENFISANPNVWNDPRNVRAAILLLLSGGHPSVGYRLLTLEPPLTEDLPLIEGALAYIEGRKQEAMAKLLPVEPLELEPSLGGQIALVQVVLRLPHDLEGALVSVDKARLLMPGSLIEEAALRRGVSVAAALDRPDLFQSYALQYIRHYRSSIYNADFRRRFGLAMRRFGASKSEETFAHIDGAITEFDIDAQRQFYLLLAYASLVEGNLDLAQKASQAALPLSMDNTEDRSRAELYAAGSMIDAEKMDSALEHLWAIKRDTLNERDKKLAESVAETLNSIRYWPETDQGSHDFIEKEKIGEPMQEDWELETILNANEALKATDLLLSFSDKPMNGGQ